MTQRQSKPPKASFQDELAALVEAADMTIPELAAAAGINDQTIRNYLAGSRVPRLPMVRALEQALPDEGFRLRAALGLPKPVRPAAPADSGAPVPAGLTRMWSEMTEDERNRVLGYAQAVIDGRA